MSRLEKFLDLYKSENTKRSYRMSLTKFFGFVYPEDLELSTKVGRYFEEKRDIKDDVQRFNSSISEIPPKTSHLYIASLKNFLIEQGLEFETRFWRRIRDRRKGSSSRARTLDTVPSNKQLKKIIENMPIQGKTLYLLLASSGARIGEVLSLVPEDLNLENNSFVVRAENSKSGDSRIAFFSEETKEYLVEWLSQRESYLETRDARAVKEGEAIEDSSRVFPFGLHNAYYLWKLALSKTHNGQRDQSTGRLRLHPHVLRKFFRTNMATLIPVDVTEALMGHSAYLTDVYRRYSQQQLADFYKQGERAVTIMGVDGEEITKIRTEFQKTQGAISDLALKNLQLETKIKQLTDLAVSQAARIDHLEKALDDYIEKEETAYAKLLKELLELKTGEKQEAILELKKEDGSIVKKQI